MLNYKDLQESIDNNYYINNCKTNTKRNFCSLSYLIKCNLSQSECIKLGFGIEKLLNDIIVEHTLLVNIKNKIIKNEIETDHLFLDNDKKIIYYSELKSNLNLDTEKSKYTCLKCLKVVEKLKTDYFGYEVVWCLVGFRFLNYKEIPKNIKNKYNDITGNLLGINEYLNMIGFNFEFTKQSYINFLNSIAFKMFKKN